MALHNEDKIKLCTGALMPKIGLGTWKVSIIIFGEFNVPYILQNLTDRHFLLQISFILKAPPEKTKAAVKEAIKAGYRMIDCANDYGNEHVIGEALHELFEDNVITR